MAKGLINESTLNDIADAIRAKLESDQTMLPSEMAGLIASIQANFPLFDKVEFLTITPTSTSKTLIVPHSLGVAPNYAMWWVTDLSNVSPANCLCGISSMNTRLAFRSQAHVSVSDVNQSGSGYLGSGITSDETTYKIVLPYAQGSSSVYVTFRAGKEYHFAIATSIL